jgi:predicted CoA-binding protein
MTRFPKPVQEFLAGRRFVVAGVSRQRGVGNAILARLRSAGYEAFPVNPNAAEIDGERCYADLASIPGEIDGVVFASHPRFAVDCVRQCAERGVPRIWFHRSFGPGSVADAAIAECHARGVEAIVGGCPLMFCSPDPVHRCMAWWLRRRGRIPA